MKTLTLIALLTALALTAPAAQAGADRLTHAEAAQTIDAAIDAARFWDEQDGEATIASMSRELERATPRRFTATVTTTRLSGAVELRHYRIKEPRGGGPIELTALD